MPRDHARLLIRIWADDDFTALTERAQLYYMRLMSQEHINRAGVLDLRPRRWARLAADGEPSTALAALRELQQARFIVIDGETEELLVRSFMRNDEIYKQPNVFKNGLNAARQVQSRRLREELSEELRRMIELIPTDRRDTETNREGVLKVADLLFHPNAKGSPNPSRNPSPNPSSKDQLHHAENTRSEPPSEPFAEPFAEPFPEPFAEPPGEGEGEGEVVISRSSVVASSENTPRRRALGHLNDTALPAPAAAILSAWRNTHQPRYTDTRYTAMGRLIAAALNAGHTPDAIKAGLAEWDSRPDAKPGLLPHLLDDIAHARRPGATTRPTVVNGKPVVPVDQIRDDDINPDDILGRDVWTCPPPPRDIEDTPAEDEWVREQLARRHTDRVAEARRVLIRRQNRSAS